jgi:hypothetical protein
MLTNWFLVARGSSVLAKSVTPARIELIGEAEVDTERRVDKALELALGLEVIAVLAKGSE